MYILGLIYWAIIRIYSILFSYVLRCGTLAVVKDDDIKDGDSAALSSRRMPQLPGNRLEIALRLMAFHKQRIIRDPANKSLEEEL
jgi:hypothetical protein